MSENKGPSHRVVVFDEGQPYNYGSCFPHQSGSGAGFNVNLEVELFDREIMLIDASVKEPREPSDRDWEKEPRFKAYALIPRKNDKGEEEKFWLACGHAFEARSGSNLKLVLRAKPLDHKIVLREIVKDEPKKSYGRK